MYTNADTLTNKIQELTLLLAVHKIDIAIVTEIKPKNRSTETTTCELTIQGYDLFSNLENDGRGIAIYITNALSSQVHQLQINTNFKENIWLSVHLKGQDSLTLGVIYRSPSSSHENNTDLVSMLKEICNTNPSHLLITGDFNYPDMNWELGTQTVKSDNNLQAFLDTLQDNYLNQHVSQPTRHRSGQHQNILDLIITNEENMITHIDYNPGLGLSDHACLEFDLNVYTSIKPQPDAKYRYHKGDYDGMNTYLSNINWEEELSKISTEESWCKFEAILNEATLTYIPKTKPKKDNRHKVWMNKAAMAKHKKKYHAWKRYQVTNDYHDYVRATQEKNELTNLTRRLCKEFEKDIAKHIKSDPKAFWKYCNSKLKTKPRLGDLETHDGSLTRDDETKAELLNSFFTSVFTQEDLTNIPTLEPKAVREHLRNIQITPEMILKKLLKLKSSKSAGPDGIHPKVLIETANNISLPLCIIFQKSLASGQVPSSWKEANVTPIHKKASKQKASNYRPISLTSIVCRIMESIIRDNIVKHMMENQLFCDSQHGFVPGRSCMTQLIIVIDKWTDMLDRGEVFDTVYLDFQKAFDSVPHNRLITKLNAYGIVGNIQQWIKEYLTNRKQRVIVNGKPSQWTNVTSGIPQGSVLGPALFVIFINDLPDAVRSSTAIFADDTKIYREVSNEEDRIILQDDLNNLMAWSQKWQLKFNADKCSVMHLGKQETPTEYTMNNSILKKTTVEKDLGVHIDNELKFHNHVAKAVLKANRILGMIKNTFSNIDETTLPMLYKALVRPHLEYGNVIWNPRFKLDEQAVEKVQRRATKLVPSLSNLTYEDRLRKLKLPSLKHRRLRGDLIQTYKIINDIDRIDTSHLFSMASGKSSSTRGHHQKIYKKNCKLNVRNNAFSMRVVNAWNDLPTTAIEAKSVNSFKTQIDKHLIRKQYIIPW